VRPQADRLVAALACRRRKAGLFAGPSMDTATNSATSTATNSATNLATNSATWTTERVQQLRTCVTAGLTCSEIAAEIGVTRNAVIGKISRLGLSLGRARGAMPGRMRASRARAAPARPSRMLHVLRQVAAMAPESFATAQAPAVESARRCSLLELTGGGCRWPLGDPCKPDFGFCGNDAIAGFSYCAGHMRIAYRLPYTRCA